MATRRRREITIGMSASATLTGDTSVRCGATWNGSDTPAARRSTSTSAASVGGASIWTFAANGHLTAVSNYSILAGNGSTAVCSFTFASEFNTGLYRIGSGNLGIAVAGTLRQDMNATRSLFTHDVVLTSSVNPTDVASVGYRGIPNIAGDKSTSFSPSAAVLTDAGAYIGFSATATYTIPTNANNAYPIGTTIMIENLNGGGTLTIHPDTGVTLRRGDGTAGTGDRTVAANSCVTIRKRGTNEWYIYGIFT